MIKTAAFDNFRKFTHLESPRLRGVTFLIGENNSGKSTFTKGILLLSHFLRNGIDRVTIKEGLCPKMNSFSFNDEDLKLTYIKTFYQALCTQSTNGIIGIDCSFDEFEIRLDLCIPSAFKKSKYDKKAEDELKCEQNHCYDFADWTAKVYPEVRNEAPELYKRTLNKDIAEIIQIQVFDFKRFVYFSIDLENLSVEISSLNAPALIQRLKDNEIEREKIDSRSSQYQRLLNERNDMEGKMKELLLHRDSEIVKGGFRVPSGQHTLMILDHFINLKMNEAKKSGDEGALDKINNVRQSYKRLRSTLDSYRTEYIPTHKVHQLSSYINDPSNLENYVDSTISQFWKMQHEQKDDIAQEFVKKWMNRFEIGEDFRIKPKGAKILSVEIMDDSIWLDLSSKGIGAIQLFLLFLRIAVIINRKCDNTTIIIEEPEQNLHPALQSRLTDFFYEVNDEFDCQFIVETHSEYLVRKSQVIVAENFSTERKAVKNPFRIFYFPREEAPYKISYTNSGHFLETMGKGFYDVADGLLV